jgi:hypothetical protein
LPSDSPVGPFPEVSRRRCQGQEYCSAILVERPILQCARYRGDRRCRS